MSDAGSMDRVFAIRNMLGRLVEAAGSARAQIGKFGLAGIVDEVLPYGSIMAGGWQKNAPWRKQ